jgi:D-beta-D-heptose 7-phosphate kinase/D-beta-D-heptose 1-phosphate adenosyltransferase
MTERAELAGLIERLDAVPVLCIGDLMLDRFVYGTVDRISPEAPIPILRIAHESAMLGGAGNVVRNLVALGAKAVFVSVVGDDRPGREVTGLIAESAEIEPYISVERGRTTTIKTRYIAGGQQLLRADQEMLDPISATVLDDLARVAVADVADTGAVILSDYGKGVLSPDLMAKVVAACRKAGKPVVVDPKGADFARYRGAGVLTPNRAELSAATGRPVDTEEQIVAAARSLIEAHGFGAILVTRGPEGMTLVRAEGATLHLPAEAREVYDVSGAGDTVVAALAAALAAGLDLEDAARIANAAAGIVVGKIGTAVASADEVYGVLHAQEVLRGEDKVVTLNEAIARVGAWRAKGETVGFTNGVFDLLHPGHVSLLRQASGACDRLVVGLNSDASVRRLKGESRPVQGEAARAAVLASMTGVDLVVVFTEDTPEKLIRAIRPDVLVKGADYSVATVVGADFVQGYGGTVLLADLIDGHSTTATIRRLSGEESGRT